MESTAQQHEPETPIFWQNVKIISTKITVEPLVFFYVFSSILAAVSTQNLNLEKACRVNIGYNASICDAMVKRDTQNYQDYQEANVQKLVARMLIIRTAIVGIIPTFIVIFLGSWSDRTSRRKPVILLPIFCDVLNGLGLLLCAYFFLELSIEYVVLFECFPYALGGGLSCLSLGIFSYISGLTSENERTIRVGAVSMFQNLGITFGNIFGGLALKPFGFVGVYCTSTFIMTCCFFYGLVIVKEKQNGKSKCFFRDFFEVKHVKNTFRVCFKDGPSNRKLKMIILMMSTFMIIGPVHGELAVVYLYTRIKFGWNEVDYSIFNTLQFIVQISGSVFALSIFSKKLKISDAMLGVIALTSKILACLVYAFSPSGSYFFSGCFVEIFHGASHIALRSLMTKIVPPHELGQSNSVFGVCEALAPFAFGPLYASLYNYTIRVFPGGFYLVSATLYIFTIPLFIWLYKCGKRDQEEKKETVKAEEKPLMQTEVVGIGGASDDKNNVKS